MDEQKRRRQELESRVAEVSLTLDGLRGQLQKARAQEQHELIDDKLEEYIEEAHVKVSDLRSFWRMVIDDLRGKSSAK